MPEMTTHPARLCGSCFKWERKVQGSSVQKGVPGPTYYVKWTKLRGHHGPIMGYTCTCPSFVHRGGECKHIKAVADERCGYGEVAFAGSPAPEESFRDGLCPECGGNTIVIEIAV